jgi:hypothetical protein
MPGFLGHTTRSLLGLEPHIWDDTDTGECMVYHWVTLSYLGYLLCTLGGMFFLMYLITSSWPTAVFFGLLVTFIIASVVRFSLIILRRSLFDQPKTVIKSGQSSVEQHVNTAKDNSDLSSAVPPHTPQQEVPLISKKAGLAGYLKKSVQSLRVSFAQPSGSSQVPGLAFLIRGVILMMMVCLVGFPLSCLIYRDRIMEINVGQREVYLSKFSAQSEAGIQVKIRPLFVQIQQLERVIEAHAGPALAKGLQAERQLQLQVLRAELEAERERLANDVELQTALYRQRLEQSHFLMLSFSAVSQMPVFSMIMLTVAMLVFFPHVLLDRLRKRQGASYAQRSTDYYRSVIDAEYQKIEEAGYRHLWERYQYDPQAFKRNIHWENPPYNTIPRVMFPKRGLIDRRQFEDHVNSSIDSSL